MAAYQIWDAQATFTAAQNVKLLIGVQNLFDTNPPYSNVGTRARVRPATPTRAGAAGPWA